jgi:hypothetical protein
MGLDSGRKKITKLEEDKMFDNDENGEIVLGHDAAREWFKQNRKKNRLTDVRVDEISVVNEPATGKKFFLMKNKTENLIERLRKVQKEIEEETGEECDIVEAASYLKRLERLNEIMDGVISKANGNYEELDLEDVDWDQVEKEFESLSKKEQRELIGELKFLDVVLTCGIEGKHYLSKLKTEGSAFWVRRFSKDPDNFYIAEDGSLRFKPHIEGMIKDDSFKKDKHGGGYETDLWGRRVYRKGKES